jgi:hypothetical protein
MVIPAGSNFRPLWGFVPISSSSGAAYDDEYGKDPSENLVKLWNFLFGKKASEPKPRAGRAYLEKDNKGTRYNSLESASSYWERQKDPAVSQQYLRYSFETENVARQALLKLPFIHVAADSQALISTEEIDFGCYRAKDGRWHVMLAGQFFTHKVWVRAKGEFAKWQGWLGGEEKPKQSQNAASS